MPWGLRRYQHTRDLPEHVHLLVRETARATLATAIQAMKQSVARRVGGRFWQERYYDCNVWSALKREEKIRVRFLFASLHSNCSTVASQSDMNDSCR